MSIFNDVVALAKAGWKPSDVKEIMDRDPRYMQKDDIGPEEVNIELKPVSKSEEKKEKSEESVDYKAKYEEAQAKLQKIYDENSRKEVTKEETNMDELFYSIANRL